MGTDTPAANPRPLRIGIMLDALVVPAWVALIIQQVEAAPYLELAVFVMNDESWPRRNPVQKVWHNRHRLLYKLYEAVDNRVYAEPDDAFVPVDLRPEFGHVESLTTVPIRRGRFEHRFDEPTLERIREADLDVMLRFGFNIIRGEILESARYGVWSFHHGDNREYRGGPAFFWELYEANPISGTTLQILTDELDGGHVIYRSWSATDPVSLRRGRNAPYWKSADFIRRRLRRLHDHGFESLRSLPTFDENPPYTRRIYRTPRNREMLGFLARVGWGILRRRSKKLIFRDDWLIAYRNSPGGRSGAAPEADPEFRVISPPRHHFYADPFVLERDGQGYIFFEDFSYESGRGAISYVSVNGTGPSGTPAVALERDYHLAYPFLFEWEGTVYMIPETSRDRSIQLYRATAFPDGWELAHVLMRDIEAVDSTLLRHDDRWWLFTNVATNGAPTSDELFLFSSDSLFGDWEPHPANPIVSDVRRARPAGRIFEFDGRLVRPSQDCSLRYGHVILFNEIRRLDRDSYEEQVIDRFGPEWLDGNLASHTYNSSPSYEVIDGLVSRRK